MDESEAVEVLTFLKQESRAAGSVWGDIYRNRYLASVRNPPSALTPAPNQEFHPNLKAAELKNSILEKSFHMPELKSSKKPSTEEHFSAIIPLSVRGNKASAPKESDAMNSAVEPSNDFRFDIDACVENAN